MNPSDSDNENGAENDILVMEPIIPMSEHLFKYFGLIFICMATLGSYFTYDVPGAFGDTAIANWYNVDEVSYGILYSVYSFPNIVMVLIGGYLVDSLLGVRLSIVIFSGLVAVGQVLFALSANLRLFWLAVLGRVVYGLGAETLYIVSFAYVSIWFFGRRDYALAFATANTIGRLAGATDLDITTKIAHKFSLPVAFWFGAILCSISFLSCLVLAYLETIRMKKENPPNCQEGVYEQQPPKSFKISDLKAFPISFWLLIILSIFFVIPVFGFIAIGTDFLQTHFPESNSSLLISLPYYVACCAPLIGALVDRFGRNLYILVVSSSLIVVAFILLAFTTVTPYVSMVCLGLSIAAVFSASFTLINSLVPEHCISVSFALNSSVINGLIAVSMIIINTILQKTNNNYMIPFIIFIIFSVASILILILMIFIDKKEQVLNVHPSVLQKKIQEKLALENQQHQEQRPLLLN
ncbi:major facilitator superfamily domain-containing protein 1 [Tieghemostelium lacteum]|uniref:Lysosomal dipeptide transporter MFSD1 n=1 Tax=Tieghemostelium lacteum TaxID=361077 RepID=A0A152A140_TIELA|nr:major facilitator superfamily domain-containing protein 1 [Tieghemostelium lacteum]|eukprot:KYQ99836.1 major facilitator superfamily domain-containing protein 1 [Tieghemostelium lacteum]